MDLVSVEMGRRRTTTTRAAAGKIKRMWLCPCGSGVKSMDLSLPRLFQAADLCASQSFSVTETEKAQGEEKEF